MTAFNPAQLYQTLQELGMISEKELSTAWDASQKSGTSFVQILIDENLINDENLGSLLAENMGVPFVNLSQLHVARDVVQLLPETFARSTQTFIYQQSDAQVSLAMSDPSRSDISDAVSRHVQRPVKVVFATTQDIARSLRLYTPEIDAVITNLLKDDGNEVPLIEIVDTVLSFGYKYQASDIHIEPEEERCLIRMRIDGILHDMAALPVELHAQIVTRIKVLAKLRTDEHQAAQDGKLQFEVDDETVDARISIVPITNGEKVVMRLLSTQARQYSLSDLGMLSHDLKKVGQAYEKPYGMILSTGPTGSGKTTTLYTILKQLNKRDINIMTIEDPVEYTITGINQIQVNPKTNLTFADGLRSIVRQDPNVILVGEVRDQETAGIAVNAAMTGHLVLSTLHTNDAATTIPRLIDMGVEPFLVASSINVIVAQRLVRRNCWRCRASREINIKDFVTIENQAETPIQAVVTTNKQDSSIPHLNVSQAVFDRHFKNLTTLRVYEGKGCDVCHHTGYVGRLGLFEVLEVSDSIKEAITQRQNADEITQLAIEQGMTTMFDDGMEKVKQGLTTLAEIIRVTKE